MSMARSTRSRRSRRSTPCPPLQDASGHEAEPLPCECCPWGEQGLPSPGGQCSKSCLAFSRRCQLAFLLIELPALSWKYRNVYFIGDNCNSFPRGLIADGGLYANPSIYHPKKGWVGWATGLWLHGPDLGASLYHGLCVQQTEMHTDMFMRVQVCTYVYTIYTGIHIIYTHIYYCLTMVSLTQMKLILAFKN